MANQDLDGAVREAAAVLQEAGVPSPKVDAELLAAHLLGIGLGELRARMLGNAKAPEGYAELVAERAQRTPLQHITGVAHFRYLELSVGPGVFVPRPETESVVQLVIDHVKGVAKPKVVDLGTGSGAIAGSIAHEVPDAEVHAVEYSPFAHAWAARNLEPLGVHLVLGDLRNALPELNGTFDVVISNPPYIPAAAIPIEPEVALHDPPEALYGGGADGMELPTAAAASAARLLVDGGYFVMEHAEVQAGWIASMLDRAGCWASITTHQDLNGRDRATSAFLVTGPASGVAGISPKVMKE
ncbi:peptide chain release factor N(5)-glutamine methyltransferase [Pseudarthrobacter sp. J75]|uniref:peptide chain release factor N(5)-glutamine methyltransferase n=1 Tax=unclassified Pseudarthrobacter TaxID=2647000 RepID=UPI002E806482|nr:MULTISPECIES: peptide chain release factor N(5)-glutamine methyltransferase [unclassified Pseudarthrobacter]MEE2521460.1 peptide chain release factor N(5)-glutamine methyltransferase [Pseudarthrobacter sp. J47]MEE2528692.1 peptide chain release factor N(5)-glutamine methyltransferase [Pseudarthrobacter sp. J75]MEE2568384.1 peptide chain release factor N(5)-glutamine methyltransferase [Pseudarthrobacter sp. J64]